MYEQGFRMFKNEKNLMFFKLILPVLFLFSAAFAQKSGENRDPDPQGKGVRPYEMKERTEERTPIITFEDCTQWLVESKGCEAGLYRSNDQLLYRDYAGKVIYKAIDRQSEITLKLKKAISFDNSWDCVNFWTYGVHWLWGEPNYKRAFKHYALIEDGAGKLHQINFVQSGVQGLVHKYWFMSHIKLSVDLRRPLKFIGIKFVGRNVTDDKPLSIYPGPIYAYREELKPLKFADYPKDLPFPVHKTTILPLNKTNKFINNISQNDKFVSFTYKGDDAELEYRVLFDGNFPLNIFLIHKDKTVKLLNGGEIVFADAGEASWQINKKRISGDTLWVETSAITAGRHIPFRFFYTIKQKSLIIGMRELTEEGHVSKVSLGNTAPVKEAKLFRIPFLNFDYAVAPRLLYADWLFYFTQFDWYYTNASKFYMEFPEIDGMSAVYNGGAQYIPKTDGVRNPLREKLFINVSPDVQEVFPTIDNPKSPMRSAQAHRLWRINGNPNHKELKEEARHLRALGIENLTIRYHEGIWRDGGESYTFRLQAASGRGGNAAVKELVDYIKSVGWRVGLYTNYTDFAPVNANWNEDWVMRGPKGEWKVSWSRCYAPKPMIALEVERHNAPIIHEMFGSNHSYCDVHTAVSPMSRVDYDYRVPGAATFRRTFECFGLLLLNEKRAYTGPVYSEGANHWWYAGLTDGNYANTSPKLNKQPVFPDFQLLKIHPLEMDAGNVPAKGDEYLTYTLAYGHIGICDGDEAEMMKRYYMLQPLQEHYSMIPVKKIQYESGGKFYNTSKALVKGLNDKARLFVEYQSGFKVYANFSDEPWQISDGGRKFSLPKFGFYAAAADKNVWALAGSSDKFSANVDLMHSPEMYYLDSKDNWYFSDELSGKGKIALKKETFGWEIIPARKFKEFAFSPALIGLDRVNLRIEALKENGLPLKDIDTRWSRGKLFVVGQADSVFKYRIVPDIGRKPAVMSCSRFKVRSNQSLAITLPAGFQGKIASLEWQIDGKNKKAAFKMLNGKFMTTIPKLSDNSERLWLKLVTDKGQIYWLDFRI